MKYGDIVRYHQEFWLVTSVDPKMTREAVIQSATGQVERIPFDLDIMNPEDCLVQGNPAGEWRLLMVPPKASLGRVVSLTAFDGRQWEPLTPYEQWVMAEPARNGGSLFIHPAVRLVLGGFVKVDHEKGSQLVRVTSKTGTLKQRKTMATPAPKPAPKTLYDRIADDD